MKALILNFSHFGGKKDTNKHYVRFMMHCIDDGALLEIFDEVSRIRIPDGVLPTEDECKKTFPRIADVDFHIAQFTGSNGRPTYKPQVDSINSWKFADLRKL